MRIGILTSGGDAPGMKRRSAVLAETNNLLQGKTTLARWRAGAFDAIEDALLL